MVGDFVMVLNALGLTPIIISVIVAFSAITIYFAFMRKA